MIARRLGLLVTLVVLVASGTYLLVYLYRWEWNRALVAGIIFVAAEIAVIGSALLRRLRALEARLDDQHRSTPAPIDRIRESAPPPTSRFEWLDPTRMNVFVPVLLGAGVILSVVAHGVERLAAATTGASREHRLAGSLDAIALPAGGLLGSPIGLGALDRVTDSGARRRARLRRGFGVFVAIFLLPASIAVIADETQDADDAPVSSGSVSVALAVHNRFTTRGPVHTAEALFIACRHTIGGSNYKASSFADAGGGLITFTITPGFGEHAERRFEGCVEDALFDRISASVLRLDHKP